MTNLFNQKLVVKAELHVLDKVVVVTVPLCHLYQIQIILD